MNGIPGSRRTGCYAGLSWTATGWTAICNANQWPSLDLHLQSGSEETMPELLENVSAEMECSGTATIWSVRTPDSQRA